MVITFLILYSVWPQSRVIILLRKINLLVLFLPRITSHRMRLLIFFLHMPYSSCFSWDFRRSVTNIWTCESRCKSTLPHLALVHILYEYLSFLSPNPQTTTRIIDEVIARNSFPMFNDLSNKILNWKSTPANISCLTCAPLQLTKPKCGNTGKTENWKRAKDSRHRLNISQWVAETHVLYVTALYSTLAVNSLTHSENSEERESKFPNLSSCNVCINISFAYGTVSGEWIRAVFRP